MKSKKTVNQLTVRIIPGIAGCYGLRFNMLLSLPLLNVDTYLDTVNMLKASFSHVGMLTTETLNDEDPKVYSALMNFEFFASTSADFPSVLDAIKARLIGVNIVLEDIVGPSGELTLAEMLKDQSLSRRTARFDW